jgi:uncharacterized protein (TIGR03437 family)
MGPRTLLFGFIILLQSLSQSYAQTSLSCSATTTNLMNRLEGLAEPTGDIQLTCAGGTPGGTVSTNITVTYPAPVTNRLTPTGAPDAVLTIDSGAGPVASPVTPSLQGMNILAFNGVILTAPEVSRTVLIRITNVRLAVGLLGGGAVTATISTTGLQLTSPTVLVASPGRGLLATYATAGITCVGSPLPPLINIPNLFAASTLFASTRVTEGFGDSFIRKDAASDAGTRIIVKYSGVPATARIFAPDFVAGNDALQPTAGGDLGGVQSGGAYSPTPGGTLLLARVLNSDATGAGGSPISTASSIAPGTAFTTVTEVALAGGVGTVVYEVIDSNAGILESAQFPTFISLPVNSSPSVVRLTLGLAPVSSVTTAMQGLPVPRFTATPPPADCQVVGDCGAAYFPVLSLSPASLTFNPPGPSIPVTNYAQINNTGGGYLAYMFSVAYQGASGWLTVTDQNPGANHTTLRLDANPITLAAGIYKATLTVDAGAAGKSSIPLTLTVPGAVVTVSRVVNAASFQTGPVVAGSLATIFGTSFNGKVVTATFDGVPGNILFSNATQINVQVPAAIAAKTSVQLVVTVDGVASAGTTVQLAAVAPGIFGTLNQDNSLNSASSLTAAGQIIQIFATGLISATSSGYLVGFANQSATPVYTGAASNGLQQVNVAVPPGLAPGSVTMEVCAIGTVPGQLICSPGVNLFAK